MIRRLKRRFVTTAMVSLLVIVLAVLGTVNLLFFRHNLEAADNLLTYLAENNGGFPPTDQSPDAAEDRELPSEKPASEKRERPSGDKPASRRSDAEPRMPDPRILGFDMTQETAFRTRCFSVVFDSSGAASQVRTDRIAAVTGEDAVSYAQRALAKTADRGFIGIYRYYVDVREGETYVGFLDYYEGFDSMKLLLWLSGLILVFCLAAMWVLLWLFSGKVIRPVAESLEKQKQFIADAGHELKTPITIIGADAAVLAMTGGDNEWVDSIRNQTRRLDGLVRELLDLSRVEVDAPLDFDDVRLSDAAADTVDGFTTVISTSGRTLDTDIQPGVSCRGNEASLRRLVSVLMENAVKYTPDGGFIRFTLRKSGHNIIISTHNTCVPIEKKHLSRLFERFYRVDPARTQSTGGYGIGLSIAREIVIRHHGKIKADCPTPDTITFTATLPAGSAR